MFQVCLAFVVCAVATLTGCATQRPASLSLTQLGSETESHTGAEGETYRSLVNISGLAPYQPLGMTTTTPSRHLSDMFSIGISHQCSKVLIQDFGKQAKQADVVALRDGLDELRRELEQVVSLKVSLVVLEKYQQKIAAATNDAESTAALTEIRTLTGDGTLTAASLSGAIKKANDDLLALQKVVSAQERKVRQARGKAGILVSRWNMADNDSFSAQLGRLIGLNTATKRQRAGFVVVGDLRMASIWFGDDLIVGVNGPGYASGIDAALRERSVVTHTLAAKHIAYVEELSVERILNASLSVKVEDINKLFGGEIAARLKDELVSLQAAFVRAMNVGEEGLISEPKRYLYEYRFSSDRAREASTLQQVMRMDKYATFFSVRTNLADIKERLAGRVTVATCAHQTEPSTLVANRLAESVCTPGETQKDDQSAKCASLVANLLAATP
ncbi:MAG TPA: hypothetical protein PK586_15950 [Casimicrobium sp.]|nr:hypothetical protein [Casimicrobium sp.]